MEYPMDSPLEEVNKSRTLVPAQRTCQQHEVAIGSRSAPVTRRAINGPQLALVADLSGAFASRCSPVPLRYRLRAAGRHTCDEQLLDDNLEQGRKIRA